MRSTLAAETNAMAEGMDMAIFLSSLYSEVVHGVVDSRTLPVVMKTDCKSLHDALLSTKDVQEKRFRVEMNAIKEQIRERQNWSVDWLRTDDQLADCLTKKGASCNKLMAVLESGRLL